MTRQGFTLIELLLSISIISILATLSLPVIVSFQVRNDTDIAVQGIVDMIRRGQLYSRANSGDSIWGVRVGGGIATLFKGTSYATRDSAYDEIVELPPNTSASGLSEVTFAKVSGLPSAGGSMIFINTTTSQTIVINTKGMVDSQ